MDKAIAYAYASDDVAYYLAERVKHSFEYFHKDIPFHIITPDQEESIFGDIVIPEIASHIVALANRYLVYLKDRYEVVVRLDADTLITGRLDEFFDKDYDVACSLNCKNVGGIDYKRFPDYCNLGVMAVRSKEFAEEWTKLTYDPEFIKKEGFNYLEQDVMNYLAFGGKYKALVVDKVGCYYNETSRDRWGDLKVRHKGLFIGDRQVKALHWAGGGELSDKYNHPAFPDDVRKFLNEISGTKDFTNG